MLSYSPNEITKPCTEQICTAVRTVTKHRVNQAVGGEVGQCPGRDIEIRAWIGHTRGTKGEFAPSRNPAHAFRTMYTLA